MYIFISAAVSAVASGVSVWYTASFLCRTAPSAQNRFILTAAAALLTGTVGGLQGMEGFYFPFLLRLAAALSASSGAVICDYQEKRIPNLFPYAMLAVWVVTSLLDMALIPGHGFASLTGGVLSGLIILALLLSFRGISQLIFHQQGLGMGDVKLLTALSALLGLETALGALLVGQFAALVCAVVLLARKKATLKDSLPFAPFLYLGLLAYLLLD